MTADTEHPMQYDSLAAAYDAWFRENPALFSSEVRALRALFPAGRKFLEIGCGTGLFSQALGIADGVEPSAAMAERARQRGVRAAAGFAERLPAADGAFGGALMVTVDCFLADPAAAFREARRVIGPGGVFLVAFLDAAAPLGAVYEASKATSPFYADAHFHTAAQIESLLRAAGFTVTGRKQTVYELKNTPQAVRDGTGEGVFAVIRAEVPAV